MARHGMALVDRVRDRAPAPRPRGPEQDTTTLAVLTTALPYALTPPPDSPDPTAERASIDRRLGASLHPCLGLPAGCELCTEPPAPH
ncbi:hypothetical protein [Streptomyces sp. NPDC001020]